mmetsp:Transcript_23427/g.60984  ORF Transcript_23427/g.60984 Transcript_23427/m.60984 type:complete len:213 (-) Transcript_23427:591-1229(-)
MSSLLLGGATKLAAGGLASPSAPCGVFSVAAAAAAVVLSKAFNTLSPTGAAAILLPTLLPAVITPLLLLPLPLLLLLLLPGPSILLLPSSMLRPWATAAPSSPLVLLETCLTSAEQDTSSCFKALPTAARIAPTGVCTARKMADAAIKLTWATAGSAPDPVATLLPATHPRCARGSSVRTMRASSAHGWPLVLYWWWGGACSMPRGSNCCFP